MPTLLADWRWSFSQLPPFALSPVGAVQVEMGDTELPPAPSAGGSNSTASVCSTVLKACDGIRAKIFEAAVKTADGPLSGRPVSDLDLKDGKIVAKDGASQDMKDFFKKTGFGAFEEYAEFVPDGAPPSAVQSLYAGKSTLVGGSKSKKLMYAFGAEFVEVKINARTREIRVPRMVGAFAGGRSSRNNDISRPQLCSFGRRQRGRTRSFVTSSRARERIGLMPGNASR